MNYMTLREAAEEWDVTPHGVNYYCIDGHISDTVKMAGI